MYKKITLNRFFLKNISLFLFIQLLSTSCSNYGDQPTSILLFEQQTEQTKQIYRVNPDGSQLELIMEFPLGVLHWLSPQGNVLAILTPQATGLPGPRPGTLTLYDTTTGEAFRTLEEVGQQASEIFPLHENVVWSPDGDKLLFLRSSPNTESVNLFVYDLSTEEVTPLTNDNGLNLAAAWSPSGDRVAFAKHKACESSAWDCPLEEQFWEIVVTDLDGSSPYPITNFHSNKLLSPNNLWFTSLCNLAWSPDATYIAFENECGGELLGAKYWKEVFIASVDSSEVRRLTTFTDAHDLSSNTLPETAFTYSLQWSSDSNSLFIGYTNAAATPDNQPHGGIFATTNNADLSTCLPATESVIGSSARWSLDSKHVAWHTEHVNLERYNVPGPTVFGKLENAQIAILNEQEELPIGPCTSRGIYWSLDSKFAAYIANESGASCGDAGVDQSIAIVSLPDLTVTQVGEPFDGDFQLIGWTYDFEK